MAALKSSCHCVFETDIPGMIAAFMWKKKAWPVLITSLTHTFCQRSGTKWDQFRLDVARLRKSSFSKTLICGPQINCQSSAGDRHRIGEKAVPNKSTTCQSNAQHQLTAIDTRGNTVLGRHFLYTHTDTHTD